MSRSRVTFDGVWKKFRRGERHDSLRDLIPSAVRRFTSTERHDALEPREFWALSDVSFEVQPGEALGIIGPNGAGKSTTLKLLSKILKPTRGRCKVHGRVGALIEVAAGFHPDLTGRENVYLQGAIMGMKRAEIARRFDEIVEFAGVVEFIDTPVKRYSTGMSARLGFSIAAHLDPDVLLIDEVLSVGDMSFQNRCLHRMETFKRGGVTVVFVSHNLEVVARLCDRALFLNSSIKAHGPSTEVIAAYSTSLQSCGTPPVQGPIRILDAVLLDQCGYRVASPVESGVPLRLRVTYSFEVTASEVTFGFLTYRTFDRLPVYDANFTWEDLRGSPAPLSGCFELEFLFSPHLTRGQYDIECHVFDNPRQQFLARLSPAALLTIGERRTWGGVANLHAAARIIHDGQRPV